MSLRICSMGGGKHGTVMLLKYGPEYDYCTFSDTLDEHPETYRDIEEYLKPYCKEIGLKWVTVYHKKKWSVLDGAEANGQPERFFWQRQCTTRHKIQPINRFLRSLPNRPTYKNPAIVDIGFTADESDRVGPPKPPKYVKKNYPLMYDGLTKADCIKIIKDKGWPLPVKSSCVFCPFAGWKNMRGLKHSDPARLNRLIQIEQADPGYPQAEHIQGQTTSSGNRKFFDGLFCRGSSV